MKLDQAAFQEALDDERLALGVRFDPHKHPRDLLGRWREVAASKGITFTETGDAVGPEYHGTIFAKKGDKHVGYLSYSYYDGEAQVNMVEIPEEHRREGIATILAGKLKEDTDAVLTPSMFIDEKGEKWWKSMGLEDEFDEFPEWSAPTPMKLEGYHGETEGKIEGGFNTPALFIGIDSKYGKHNSVALAAYGDVKVVLRDGVKDRVTVTDGDSLMSPWAYPSPAREIDEVTTASTGDPLEFGREYAFGQQGANYVEAQIFGEVTTDQIRTVIFGTGAPDAELEKKLDDAGIDWNVDPDWRNNAQDSADDYTSYDAGGLRPFEEADQELLAIRFNPTRHPRDVLGQFRDVLNRTHHTWHGSPEPLSGEPFDKSTIFTAGKSDAALWGGVGDAGFPNAAVYPVEYKARKTMVLDPGDTNRILKELGLTGADPFSETPRIAEWARMHGYDAIEIPKKTVEAAYSGDDFWGTGQVLILKPDKAYIGPPETWDGDVGGYVPVPKKPKLGVRIPAEGAVQDETTVHIPETNDRVQGRLLGPDDLTEPVYHVTVNRSAVNKDGFLTVGKGGGLGAFGLEPSVSFTTDKAVAEDLVDTMQTNIRLAQAIEPPPPLPSYGLPDRAPEGKTLADWSREQVPIQKRIRAVRAEWGHRMFDLVDQEAQSRGYRMPYTEEQRETIADSYSWKDFVNLMWGHRPEEQGGNPIFIGLEQADQAARDPNDLGIFEAQPDDVFGTGALVVGLGAHGLHEIRVYGDVPVREVQ